jgi:hypothetical protein
VTSRRAPETADRHRVWLYVISGIVGGVVIGGLLSLWITLIYLVAGSQAFTENETTYGAVVVVYLAGGALVGAVFGVLRPWIRGRWSAAAMGFVGGCLVFSMIGLARGDHNPAAVLISALILGAPVGWRYWTIFS